MNQFRSRILSLALGAAIFVTGAAPAKAQPFDLFRGLLGAAQIQMASDAWARVPGLRRDCLERGLQERRADLAGVIQSGMMPNDPRLAPLDAQCRRFTEASLRRDYPCIIEDDTGQPIRTTCRQSFGQRDPNGQMAPVSIRDAIDLHFSGDPPVLMDVETDDARQKRHERQEAQQRSERLAGLRSQLSPLQSSPVLIVRAEVAKALTRIEQAGTRPGLPASAVEALAQDAQALTRLAEAEGVRQGALERVSVLKAQAENRSRGPVPDHLRKRLEALNAEFASVSAPPRPAPITAPPKNSRPEVGPTGPSFDCAKAVTPLPQIICGDVGLRRLDLEMSRPFYALRHLAPDRQDELKAEAADFVSRVLASCRIPETGRTNPDLARRAAPCIAAAYRTQRDAYGKRVLQAGSAGAHQELQRPIQDHLRLQEELKHAGYLPADAAADGVFGGMTRQAITTLQRAEGLTPDGFMSDAVAAQLVSQGAAGAVSTVPVPSADPALLQRIQALQDRYAAFLSDFATFERERAAQIATAERERAERAAAAERERAAQAAAMEQVRKRRVEVQDILDKPLPEPLRLTLRGLAAEMERAERERSPAEFARVDRLYAQVRPRLEEAQVLWRALTDKNRFLVEGDPDDVLFLYNASPKAPSVVRALNGDLRFDPDRTASCLMHEPIEDRPTLHLLKGRAAALGIPLSLPLPRCVADRLQSHDVVVFRRGLLLGQPQALFTTLASAVDASVFASAGVLTGAEIKTAAQANARAATEVEIQVEKAAPGGYALIVFGDGSPSVCRVVPAGAEKIHDALLRQHQDRLIEQLRGVPTLSTASADGAFLSAKRALCGAIYASAPDLKAIVAASRRDGLTLEARLRVQYGAMVRAFEERLGQEVKDFVQAQQANDRTSSATVWFEQRYPALARRYRELKADRWELMTVDTTIVDYGLAEFKGRPLETAFAESSIRLRNRTLGDYKTLCFTTGHINDTEFGVLREPIAVPCEDSPAALERYKVSQRFTSRWVVP